MCENGWTQGPPKSLKMSKNQSKKGPQTQPCFRKGPQEAPKGSQGRPGDDFGVIFSVCWVRFRVFHVFIAIFILKSVFTHVFIAICCCIFLWLLRGAFSGFFLPRPE